MVSVISLKLMHLLSASVLIDHWHWDKIQNLDKGSWVEGVVDSKDRVGKFIPMKKLIDSNQTNPIEEVSVKILTGPRH